MEDVNPIAMEQNSQKFFHDKKQRDLEGVFQKLRARQVTPYTTIGMDLDQTPTGQTQKVRMPEP